ncbi:hypothetical protein NLJ89_g4538 [Agrocybe chaxingu]|uniref:Peptide hydrolase n=1 Tax=Agrocybe chaxingu TaxID=84603 RepID=A0A9W8K2Q7_9AGAR|nr:hypothetical protein NLJ89_g4538 [Agrocybe chaxingu]
MKITSCFVLLSFASLACAQGLRPSRKPLVDSDSLRRTIKGSNLLKHARKFVEFSKLSNGTRVFGSAGHTATTNYIKRVLDATGYYDTELQTFPYLFSTGTASLAANGTTFTTGYLSYAPSGDVTAPLVVVNDLGCNASDYPAAVAGGIALVLRGVCPFGEKVARAGAAGAVGTIVYNNLDGSVPGGTLGEISRPEIGPYVPAGTLSGIDGTALVALINSGTEVVGEFHVEAINEERLSSNVFATTKLGDHENVIVAGGHSDSVVAGPGINDDGSGTMGILEVALQLPKWRVNNAVRFAFWTAEEFGLIGSEYYISHLPEEERQKIALYLNFDMIASPNTAFFIYSGVNEPAGSVHIHETFEEHYVGKIKTALTPFGTGSDYRPFLDVGIPSGGLFTGAGGIMTEEQAGWWNAQAGVAYDICYHQACDGIANLNVSAWELNTRGAAHNIATYARSLEGIPRPRVSVPARTLKLADLSYEERLHQACSHEVSVV